MARPRAKRVAAAATDAAPDGKRQKRRGFVITFTAVAPADVSPVPLESILFPTEASKRAARQAKDAATEKLHIKKDSEEEFELFAKPFGAAVASACAEEGPVSMTKVITAIAETGCELNIAKSLLECFAWRGFKEGRWQISRLVARKGLVAYPTLGHARPCGQEVKKWRFSPSPAARCPLAELSCEPSPESRAGCVVC